MESCPQFNLRWTNHSFNIIQVFMEQLSSESLVDVTLSCQGQFLKAHKMILSACSPYFQDLFSIHQAQHPVVIFNGIKFHDLKMVVEFMYRGETRVLDSELNDILAVAEALQVKGLCTVRNKYDKVQIQGANDDLHIEETEEQFVCNTPPDLAELDPLELPSQSDSQSVESLKPPRKRKRPSRAKSGVTQNKSNLAHLEVPMEVPEAPSSKVPRTNIASTSKSKTPPAKGTSPKASSLRLPSLRTLSPSEASLSEVSPGAPSTRTLSPKESLSEETSSKKSSTPSKLQSTKVHSAKSSSSKAKKPSETAASPLKEAEEENSLVLPCVQVTMSEPPDDDIDLASTIKVEPLFIRDIDDNDTSWDDPSRLVIDLPPEELEPSKDESPNAQSTPQKDKNNRTPIKTTFVLKPKLKVRPVSELVAPSQSVKSSADGTNSDQASAITDEMVMSLQCNERRKGNKIPRPPNAFMIFANEWRRKLAVENPTDTNKQISVRLGLKWKTMTTENKAIYFTASRKADEEHKQKYPNYIYSPKEARLRKSQMQALRQKMQSKQVAARPPKKLGSSVKITKSDPLKITTANNCDTSSVNISNSMNTDVVTVKEELLDDETNPQNLEEEFLKMVEEGQVEAEIHEDDEHNSVTEIRSDQSNQAENH